MTLPWDDPNADPLEDIRQLAERPPPPPGQPVLVPKRLKDMLAGQVPDNHLVTYPELAMTLVEFILARYDELEQAARAASHGAPGAGRAHA